MTTHAEKCKVIAEAIGHKNIKYFTEKDQVWLCKVPVEAFRTNWYHYDPLTNDAQNHELIRVFDMSIEERSVVTKKWRVWADEECFADKDLNTAVFECAYQAVIAGWKL